MDLKDKITQATKQKIYALVTENQVLHNLLNERKKMMDDQVREILMANKLDTKMYALQIDFHQNIWEAKMKPGTIALPGDIKPLSVPLNMRRG